QISKFLADLDPNIPYTLLAFYPQYMLYDLPTTRSKHAHECYERAKRYLRNVRIGNVQLLS
ncbi:MAG: radical SAM protein, partial [Nitrososphaeria archaeon]